MCRDDVRTEIEILSSELKSSRAITMAACFVTKSNIRRMHFFLNTQGEGSHVWDFDEQLREMQYVGGLLYGEDDGAVVRLDDLEEHAARADKA